RLRFSGPKTSIIRTPTTSLKTSIKTITNLSDTNCLEIHGASLHVIFYLDGHHTQKPFPLVQRVSEFWREITNAEGYYNWSNYKKNYQADINRKINHSDIKSINELRYIISYLAKEEQKNGMYIWGSNEVPPPSGLGRPRNSDSL
ncbi:hypothetical protein CEQ52_08900, partial [Enterobacter kobei]